MYIFLSTYSGYYLNCSVLITGKKRKHTSNNILIVTKTYPSHTDVIVQLDTTQSGKLHLKINCLLNLRIWYVVTHSLSTRIEEKKKQWCTPNFFFQFPVSGWLPHRFMGFFSWRHRRHLFVWPYWHLWRNYVTYVYYTCICMKIGLFNTLIPLWYLI